MAAITCMMFNEVVEQFYKYDVKRSVRIEQKKAVLNILQREISTFLVLLARQSLSPDNSMGIPVMLHMVNDLTHMGDQNELLLELLRRKKEDKITFSGTAMTELKTLAAKVGELVHLSVESVDKEINGEMQTVRNGKEGIGQMQEAMLNTHMKRLTGGKCTVAAGVVYSDIISAFGKIADYSCTLLEMERELIHGNSGGSN